MACALLLSWWHWINLYWLGSEKHVYSVTLSNIFKLDSYGHVPVIYNIQVTISQVTYWDLCTYGLLVFIFSSQRQQIKTFLYLSLCLIDKSSYSSTSSFFYKFKFIPRQYYTDLHRLHIDFHMSCFRLGRLL